LITPSSSATIIGHETGSRGASAGTANDVIIAAIARAFIKIPRRTDVALQLGRSLILIAALDGFAPPRGPSMRASNCGGTVLPVAARELPRLVICRS
jgi:hypothetical protein